jgi:hypothetical protein
MTLNNTAAVTMPVIAAPILRGQFIVTLDHPVSVGGLFRQPSRFARFRALLDTQIARSHKAAIGHRSD